MRSTVLYVLLMFFIAIPTLHAAPALAQQKGNVSAEQSAGPAAEPPNASAAGQATDVESDLRQMRSILYQMRTNLAFVQTTQSPLKHQFELEVDMWQALLDHMERNLRAKRRNDAEPQH